MEPGDGDPLIERIGVRLHFRPQLWPYLTILRCPGPRELGSDTISEMRDPELESRSPMKSCLTPIPGERRVEGDFEQEMVGHDDRALNGCQVRRKYNDEDGRR